MQKSFTGCWSSFPGPGSSCDLSFLALAEILSHVLLEKSQFKVNGAEAGRVTEEEDENEKLL